MSAWRSGGGGGRGRLYNLGLWLVLVGLFDVVGPLGSCGDRPERIRPGPEAPAGREAAQAAASGAASGAASAAASVLPGGRPSDLIAAPPAAADTSALLAYVETYVGGAAPGDPVPLVVAIHGLGDRPEDFAQVLRGFDQPARVLAPRGKRPWGPGFTWFKLASDGGGDRTADVADSAARIVALVKARQAAAPTRGRPMVLGFSQGGILAFWLAAHHPEVFSLAVPIAGLLTPDTWPPARTAAAAGPPACRVVALHGDADARIPFADGQATLEAFQRSGYSARFVSFPGVGHTIPPAMRLALNAALAEAIGGFPADPPAGAPATP